MSHDHHDALTAATCDVTPADIDEMGSSAPVTANTIASAIDFLKAFHPGDLWALTAIGPESGKTQTATFGPNSAGDAQVWIEARNGTSNLYFAVNPLREAMTKKAKATDVAALVYLHVDIDPRVGEDLEAERARILALLTTNLPAGVPKPTAVVFSGGGYQAFWKLDEPVLLDGSVEAAEQAKLWNVQLERLFNADSCHNIDRIMRLPFTWNVPSKKKLAKGRTKVEACLVDADFACVYSLDAFKKADVGESKRAPSVDRPSISIGDVIEPIGSLAELDRWQVPSRIKVIIEKGFHPDETNKPHDDRNRWVFDVVCALVRCKVPHDVIFSLLTDTRFRISERVLEQRAIRKHVEREIARATERVAVEDGGFEVDQKERPQKESQRNVEIALARMGVTVKLDEFSDRVLVEGLKTEDVVLDDRIMSHLRLDADRRFKFLARKDFWYDVVADLALRNAYHPVCDYLGGLEWDREGRIDEWLVRYCGVEDSEYVRAVSRIVLMAAVRRVRQPGVKFDEMLVLEGAQGLGKSQVLKALAVKEEWFTDEVPLAGDGKEVIEALRGRWIAEAAELKGMRAKEVEHLKAFLSRTHDRARLAYGRLTTEVARSFVMIGTTNSEHYLVDSTGNRRFWPVKATAVDLDGLVAARDQLWAEAAHREAEGESIHLPEKLWAVAGVEQEKRALEDPYLAILTEALGGRWGRIAVEDVFRLIGVEKGQRTQHHNARVGEAMRQLGWRREKQRRDGVQTYCYVNCGSSQDSPWLSVADRGDGKLVIDRGKDPQSAYDLPF